MNPPLNNDSNELLHLSELMHLKVHQQREHSSVGIITDLWVDAPERWLNRHEGRREDYPDRKFLTKLSDWVTSKPTTHPKLGAICIAHFTDGYRRSHSARVSHWEEYMVIKLDMLRSACRRHQVSLTEHQLTDWGDFPRNTL